MSKNWRVWSLAGVVGLAVAAVGFAATTPAKATTGTKAKTTTAKPMTAKTMAAIGTVSAVDAGAGTLTVKASKGDESFKLESSTKVLDGHGKAMAESELSQGQKVKVYYTSKDGQKDASRVYVLSHSATSGKATKH